MNTIYRGFVIRLYPTEKQQVLMRKHIDACRFIWNYMLETNIRNYQNGEKHLGKYDMMNLIKPLKNDEDHLWLKDVSHSSLQIICSDLNSAYERFFKKINRFPKFKAKKKCKQTFPIRPERTYFRNDYEIQIPNIGVVKYKSDRKFTIGNHKIKMANPRIKFENGMWLLSFNLQREKQAVMLNDYSVGIDLGVKELAVISYGNNSKVYHNINKTKRVKILKKRMAHAQRSVWRKKEAAKIDGKYSKEHSKNEEKALEKYRRLHLKLANIRDNYIHQTTAEIVKLYPKRVIMEDLHVMHMIRNKSLRGSIWEENFSKFKIYMQYKCENYGIDFVLADQFFPSSKMCSKCGCIKKELSLHTRIFVCDDCGYVIDRDLNAAVNLMNYVA